MSRRYLVLARIGEKLQMLLLTTNGNPTTLKERGYRMLKAWFRQAPVEVLKIWTAGRPTQGW
ncbi:MAG: hypothetical protein HY644_11225 [Acidobacteria bacterium]|nr:hypothetical protein [Acidobacteriota bacterium]